MFVEDPPCESESFASMALLSSDAHLVPPNVVDPLKGVLTTMALLCAEQWFGHYMGLKVG